MQCGGFEDKQFFSSTSVQPKISKFVFTNMLSDVTTVFKCGKGKDDICPSVYYKVKHYCEIL